MESKPYFIVELSQRTPEWLEWRNQGIGASDAPTIMGENPWSRPEQLLQEKVEGRSHFPKYQNNKMARGIALEPQARKLYQRHFGVAVYPVCLQSIRFDWLKASVDGLSRDGKTVVEIKCGERVYELTAAEDRVPDYYYGQLQHILAVTGLPIIDFWCYLPDRPFVHLTVPRDERYITRLLKAEMAFWQKVQDL